MFSEALSKNVVILSVLSLFFVGEELTTPSEKQIPGEGGEHPWWKGGYCKYPPSAATALVRIFFFPLFFPSLFYFSFCISMGRTSVSQILHAQLVRVEERGISPGPVQI